MEQLVTLSDLAVDARITMLDQEHYTPRSANHTLCASAYFEKNDSVYAAEFTFSHDHLDIQHKFSINGCHLAVDLFASGRYGDFGIAAANTLHSSWLKCPPGGVELDVKAKILNLNAPNNKNIEMSVHLVQHNRLFYVEKIVATIPVLEAAMLFTRYKKYRAQIS